MIVLPRAMPRSRRRIAAAFLRRWALLPRRPKVQVPVDWRVPTTGTYGTLYIVGARNGLLPRVRRDPSSMMQTQAELLALRLWLGLADCSDIDEWLDEYVNTVAEPHADALEFFELEASQLEPAFMAFAREHFGFEPESERGSRLATTLLAQLCERALRGEISVPRFCELISRVDAKYFDPALRAPQPVGLTELWCGCDWCEDSWTLEDPPGTREILQHHIDLVRRQQSDE